jgi:hypothetical protein
MSKLPWRRQANALAIETCAAWKDDELPLAESYRLLSVDDVSDAFASDLIQNELMSDASGRYLFRGLGWILPRLHTMVLAKLRSGEFAADTIAAGTELQGRRTRLSTRAWEALSADFEKSFVRANGKVVGLAVMVRRATPEFVRPQPILRRELAAWFKQLKSDCPDGLSEEECYRRAKTAFPGRVSRDRVRAIRQELAPAWVRGAGRPQNRPK